MAEAIGKRIADRIPFVRTLTYWANSDKYMRWLVGRWKVTRGHDNSDVLIVDFRVETGGVFGYVVKADISASRNGIRDGDLVFRGYQEIGEGHADYRKDRRRAFGECLYAYAQAPLGWERGFIDTARGAIYQQQVGCLLSTYGNDRIEKFD